MGKSNQIGIIGNAHAGIDAARVLGVRPVTFERYKSQNTGKIHFTCEDDARMSLLCGHTTSNFDYMDDVNKEWIDIHAETEGVCKSCLRSANVIIGSWQG